MDIKILEIEESWRAGEMEALIEVEGFHCPIQIFGNHDDGVVDEITESRAVVNEDGYALDLPVAMIERTALNHAICKWRESEGIGQ